MTTAHAKLSPSSAARYMRCPGSVRESAKYPERPSGPSAIDGTHSHTLLEHCIKNEMLDPTTMIGKDMSDHEGAFVVDADRAARVKVAVDYVRERSMNGLFTVLSETRVDPHKYTGFHEQAGTVDIRIYRSDMLEVIDYKDGMIDVSPADNEQLELYDLGALAELEDDRRFKYVRNTIVQPKLALKGLKPISSHDYLATDILALGAKYRAGAIATMPADAPLVPGEKQCRWCPVQQCAARDAHSLKAAGVNFPTITPDSLAAVGDASAQLAAQDPNALTDEKLREILEAAPLLRQTIEQAEAEAMRRLEAGKPVPGLKLVVGRGSQVWNLPEEQIAEKLKGMGVPKDAVFVTKIVSPAQAKKLTWENRKGEKKTLTERQLKTMETEYISKLGGKLTVALESDPRPAVTVNAAPLFSAVEAAPAPAAAEAPASTPPAMPDWMQVPAWMQSAM